MQKFKETENLKMQLLYQVNQITNPQSLKMAYGFCHRLAECDAKTEEPEDNAPTFESIMAEQNRDYKSGIIETLDHISDNDSVFLRQILIILLRHTEKKGGATV